MAHLVFYVVVVAMFAFKGEAQAATADGYLLAQNNDVYNFYFQKGPAPATVIQGGSGQGTGQAALPAATAIPETAPSQNPLAPPEASTTAKLEAPPAIFDPMAGRRYELFLGGTRVFDDLGTADGYSFGGQYNFNKFIGLRGVAHYLDANTQEGGRRSPYGMERKPNDNLWGGQLALAITPFHIDLFGHKFLKISALGGARSERRYKKPDYNCIQPDIDMGICEDPGIDAETKIAAFYGASVLFNINENFGVEASVASADGGKAAQVSGNLAFTF